MSDFGSGILPYITAMLCVGLISNDVKDGWLRTLLMRPITRQQYFLTKVLAVFCSSFMIMLFTVTVPVAVKALTISAPIVNLPLIVSVHLLLVAETLLLILLFAFFSCFLPGALNVLAVGAWALVSLLMMFFVQRRLWNMSWAVVGQEFFFPSGFLDALNELGQGLPFPLASLLWGIGSTGVFGALSLKLLSRIQVDKGSE